MKKFTYFLAAALMSCIQLNAQIPLISKINPREYPLIKFKGHSFFFFIDKIH